MAKTMETSRDDEHEEDVVLMRRGHHRRQPPPEDEAHPSWSSLFSTSDGTSPRDVARTTVTTERGIHV